MKKPPMIKDFGKRLASIRKDRGFSQRELAHELGISNRVVAYYEAQSKHVPANLLIPIAMTLKISLDELLGAKELKTQMDPQQKSLWKKLKKVEDLPKKDKKILLDFLNALINKNSSN